MERIDLNHYKGFTDWLTSLRNVPEDTWITPIADGKWAVQGIISHMMLWDKFFLENAINPVVNHKPITLPDTFDFDGFNRNAAARHTNAYSPTSLHVQSFRDGAHRRVL